MEAHSCLTLLLLENVVFSILLSLTSMLTLRVAASLAVRASMVDLLDYVYSGFSPVANANLAELTNRG